MPDEPKESARDYGSRPGAPINSPAGGGGSGYFKEARLLGYDLSNGVHHQAPVARQVLLAQATVNPVVPKSRPQESLAQKIYEKASRLAESRAAAVSVRGAGKHHESKCWDLPERLLQDSEASTSRDLTPKDDWEAAHYVWGEEVPLDEAQPGYILQFDLHHFSTVTTTVAECTEGKRHITATEEDSVEHSRGPPKSPNHSALLLERSASQMTVAEQHVLGLKTVVKSVVYLQPQELSRKTTTETFTPHREIKDDDGDVVMRKIPYANCRVTRTVTVTDVSDTGDTIKAYKPIPK
jgi:hypothetical protein